MNKEQQIEQMAKIIDDRLIEANSWLGTMYKGIGHWIAQKLIEHYQPKLPKDSVVLSRDNYNRLKRDSELYEARHKEKLKLFAKAYNQGSKETAKEILKMIYDGRNGYWDSCDCGKDETYWRDNSIQGTLNEIKERYGVKVEE